MGNAFAIIFRNFKKIQFNAGKLPASVWSFFSWGGTIPILLHFPLLCSFFLFPTPQFFFVFPNRSTVPTPSPVALLGPLPFSLSPSEAASPPPLPPFIAIRFVGLFRSGFSKPRFATSRQSDHLTRHHLLRLLHPRLKNLVFQRSRLADGLGSVTQGDRKRLLMKEIYQLLSPSKYPKLNGLFLNDLTKNWIKIEKKIKKYILN